MQLTVAPPTRTQLMTTIIQHDHLENQSQQFHHDDDNNFIIQECDIPVQREEEKEEGLQPEDKQNNNNSNLPSKPASHQYPLVVDGSGVGV